MSTKAELQAALTSANVSFKAKDNKAALQALLDASTNSNVRKQRVSTKQLIRNMFPNVGDTHSVASVLENIAQHTTVQAATVTTMIGDLKNPKYAAGACIAIVRNANNYVRES